MERFNARSTAGLCAFFGSMLLFFASLGANVLFRPQVRTVDALGLFASGMGCGGVLAGLIVTLVHRRKARREEGSGVEVGPNRADQGADADWPRE